MKTSLGLISLVLFLGFFSAVPAKAECGVTYTCVQSFTLSAPSIVGDLSDETTATIIATLPPGYSDWTVAFGGTRPAFTCVNGEYFPGAPGTASGCHVQGNTVTAIFKSWNGSGSTAHLTIRAQASELDSGILQNLDVTPVPSPVQSPTRATDLPCNCESGGSPINVTNGNTWIPQTDYSIPGLGGGLQLARTWNSLWTLTNPPETSGVFGHSWRSNFEERIQVLTGGEVKYWKGDGSPLFYQYSGTGGAYSLTAPADDQTTLSFDSGTTLWTVTLKDGTVKIFNNAGYLTSITDRNGNNTSISIDAAHQNRIATVTDPVGRTLTFNYTNSTFPRLCTSITDSVGTIASYTYDSSGRLTQVTYPDSSQFNYTYDTNDLILSVTDSQSKVIEAHTYDSQRRGLTSQQANDSMGHPVNQVGVQYQVGAPYYNYVSDSKGNGVYVTVVNVAQRQYLVATSTGDYACATCRFEGNSQSSYTATGYLDSHTDAAGNTAYYSYDGEGNLLSKSLPEGDPFTGVTGYDVWHYTYNSFGEVLTSTDPLGHTSSNTYDSHGNLLSTTTPSPDGGTTAASTTSFIYDFVG